MNKHLRYAGYILRHKWFVFLECAKRGLWWRGLMHDMSKLRPSEWTAYVNYFYGRQQSDGNYRVKEDFDRAWLHHQHRNPHHHQWWVLKEDSGGTKVIAMPQVYRVEMLCDWIGAGKAQGKSDTAAWYLQNKNRMLLHPSTRAWVEMELDIPIHKRSV